MQCLSCSNDVPSKFAHAIKTNCCPFCGNEIMAKELQQILNNLHDTMTEAAEQEYQEQALSWVCSNFNLISRDDNDFLTQIETLKSENEKLKNDIAELKEKGVKPVPKSGQQQAKQQIDESKMVVDKEGNKMQIEGDAIQDPEITQGFMDRANMNFKKEKSDAEIRQLAKQVKKSGGIIVQEEASEIAGEEGLSSEEMEALGDLAASSAPKMISDISYNSYDDGLGGEDLPPLPLEMRMMGRSGAIKQSDAETLMKMREKIALNQRGGGWDASKIKR
jgi:hypothetical protein